MNPAPARDLLVISDLHLGDLGANGLLEQELCSFLDHHRADGRWRLVVNGDMIDLVGVTVMPADVGWLTGLHPDDHLYGLGARAHAAALKLRWVIERHAAVFRALGSFVGAGHTVAIVVGNHDVELHWPEVQQVLLDGIAAVTPGVDPDVIRAGITVHDWVFFEEGVAWIEHGHQYDPYCSFEEVLEPATDEQEADPNLGALLPRYIGGQVQDDIHHLWGSTFWGYLRFWAGQGTDRLQAIVGAYLDVFRRMVEHWRARLPERLAARRARARERLRRVARRLRLPEERLLALAALAVPPVSVDLGRIVRALMIDRLVLLVFGPLVALIPFVLLPWEWVPLGAIGALVPLTWFGRSSLVAREPTDPSETMRRIARSIRELAKVPIVVMGHSHAACAEGDGRGWYFNTGTWVGSDPDRPFTHLRIVHTDRGWRAALCQWRDGASRAYDAAGLASFAWVPRSPE
ncbi:MAG: hypothetical protein ABMB14_25605 [Myxococcota bacterium]